MKATFQKIVAVFLSAIVLLTTSSFTVGMHFCGDHLVDVALFQKAKTCGMEITPDNQDFDAKIEQKSCCKDKQILLEGENELQSQNQNFTIVQLSVLLSFDYAYALLFETDNDNSSVFNGHSPPLLDIDYQVLYDTFLI